MTMSLTDWLEAHHGVRNALFWEHAPHTPAGGQYTAWDASRTSDLHDAYSAAVNEQPTGLQDPPHNQIHPADADGARTVIGPDDAWRIYVTTVAQSLAVEIHQLESWSIVGTPAAELAILFDSRQFFNWSANEQGYEVGFSVAGNATPCAPDTAYAFVHGLLHPPKTHGALHLGVAQGAEVVAVPSLPPLVIDPRVQAIETVLAWCRDHLLHFWGGTDAKNMDDTWQYRGLTPVQRVIAGTHNHADPSNTFGHWTAGCHGTTGFLRAVLRTVNIAVEYTTQAGHAQPHFVHQQVWLDHGDDPYTSFVRGWPDAAVPPFAIGMILQSDAEHTQRFGPNVSDEQRGKNIERHILDLALQWLPTILLAYYIRDTANGKTHANGYVATEIFGHTYSLHHLQEQHLWQRMDDKIASLGGPDTIPPMYY